MKISEYMESLLCRESEQEEEKEEIEVEKEEGEENEEEGEESENENEDEGEKPSGVEARDEVVAIDNQSEVKQNTDPDVVELSDSMIAEMMRKMLSKGGLSDDMEEEEEEEKEKKLNKNSRQNKKRLEEQRAAFRKEKEAREKKEKELFEAHKNKPAPSVIKTRPLSNAGSKLTALALKQKNAEKAKPKPKPKPKPMSMPKAKPEANTQAKKESSEVDIHKIFNRSGNFACLSSLCSRPFDRPEAGPHSLQPLDGRTAERKICGGRGYDNGVVCFRHLQLLCHHHRLRILHRRTGRDDEKAYRQDLRKGRLRALR